MDEKQLNLNAPLLSIRRLSTASSNLDEFSRKPKPTRQQSLPLSKSEWEPEHEDTKPAAIPFLWEQTPGKPKNRKKPSALLSTNHPNSPPSPLGTTPTDEESPEYSHPDPSETLSISFSFSEENSDFESSRSFSSDSQTRDYLMNRFLPAAKSMVVETPQYVSKKQENVVVEPPKYVKKVYSGELRPLLLEKYPVNSASFFECENEKGKDGFEGTKKKTGKKGFGFFLPRICTKRSSCLLNPSSGSKSKIHESRSPPVAIPGHSSSPGPVPRLSRRTSYSGPLTPSIEKQAMDAVIRKRAEFRPKEVHETQLKPSPYTSDSPSRGSSRSGRISPYRNESPRSPFHDGARFLGVPKEVQNPTIQPKTCPSLNVKSHFSPRLIHDSPPRVPEKTLYIDWIEKPTNPAPNGSKVEPFGGSEAPLEASRIPPLPKSPSESWLWRTMTLRSPFPKKTEVGRVEKSPTWETIVKTSNARQDHVRYSEELLSVSMYSEISF